MLATRLFTVEEANRLLGPLDELLRRAQAITGRMREARDNLVDLQIIWGEKVESEECPDHDEYAKFRETFAAAERELAHVLGEARDLGCDIKDVELGLVDFCASRGEEVVCLCWRRGEERVRFWHTMSEGFAGRKPIDVD